MSKETIFSARRKDFRVDYFRGSGAGGQHRNKTDSAVRITHIESGLKAECQETRDQHKNKAIAFKKLCKLLVDHYCKKEQKSRYAAGKEVIRTYHEPDDRITDHNSGKQYSWKHTIGKNDMSKMIEQRCKDMAPSII